jgi:thiol-disulfide isomerase/thioredoxin
MENLQNQNNDIKKDRPIKIPKDKVIKISIITLVVLSVVAVIITSLVVNHNALEVNPNEIVNDSTTDFVLINLGDTVSCEPCRRIRPEVDALKEKYQGEIVINSYNVNYDSEGISLANEYNVSTIPTLIFLVKGVEVHRTSGYRTQEEIEADFTMLGWIK